MHSLSFEIMRAALGGVVPGNARVLDVGSCIQDGQDRSYRELMEGREYIGADLVSGPNVDVVMPGPCELPFEDGEFGAVISGQMLEHCERPWRMVPEMARVLAVGGMMILIAPASGPQHLCPLDCWRILPDGMRILGRDAGLETVVIARASVAPWYDVLGVFKKVAA